MCVPSGSPTSAEPMQELLARIEESDGPPPGVPATGLKVLFDGAQGTAVVLQYFERAEDMEAGGQCSGRSIRRRRLARVHRWRCPR